MVNTPQRPSVTQRVLLADPDPAVRRSYHTRLLEGYDVLHAVDGRDALVTALVRAPHLVITELRLGLLDGFTLCEILRRDHATATTPIIVVANDLDPTDLQRALKVGADAVHPKDTDLEALRDDMLRLLTHGRPAAERIEQRRQQTDGDLEGSGKLFTQYAWKGAVQSKAHRRGVTTRPPEPPPLLRCPHCARMLAYRSSYVGGVNARHPEQWDVFACDTCGRFEYRQRTGILRSVK